MAVNIAKLPFPDGGGRGSKDSRIFKNLIRNKKFAECKRRYPEAYRLFKNDKIRKHKRGYKSKTPIHKLHPDQFVGPRLPSGRHVDGKDHHPYKPDSHLKLTRYYRNHKLPRKRSGMKNPEHQITRKNPKGAGRPHDPIDYEESYAKEKKIYDMMSEMDGCIKFANVPGLYTEGKYSAKEKLYAMCAWLVFGNNSKASQHSGIPAGTISGFKKQEWWNTILDEIRKDKQGELDIALTGVIHKAADVMADRLENGDMKPLKNKDGEFQYVSHPVTARDAAQVAALMSDRRALMRGDPTSRIERSTQDTLNDLSEQFKKFAKAKQVDGEVVDVKKEEE